MRINATGRTRASAKTKTKSKAGSAGNFTPDSVGTDETSRAASTASASPIASLDALIALQGQEDFTQARRRATARADDLLDILSDVRLGLLEGALPVRTLQRLGSTLQRARANTGDARLESLLNEIEIRAEVEKAKLDFAS